MRIAAHSRDVCVSYVTGGVFFYPIILAGGCCNAHVELCIAGIHVGPPGYPLEGVVEALGST